ncbi:MAG: hypothetical protein V7K33_20120 [Nostoc sp.]
MSSVLADELFYNTSNGAGAVGVFDRFGNFTQSQGYPAGSFSSGWSEIVNIPQGVFFYSASNGVATFGVF